MSRYRQKAHDRHTMLRAEERDQWGLYLAARSEAARRGAIESHHVVSQLKEAFRERQPETLGAPCDSYLQAARMLASVCDPTGAVTRRCRQESLLQRLLTGVRPWPALMG